MSLLKHSFSAEENFKVFLAEITKPKYLEEGLVIEPEDVTLFIKIIEMLLD
tara:strand:- start:166 stop:318 length:153 start_codon:yes stop_codon:yes gene_type:complete